jgi:hypothetical protein
LEKKVDELQKVAMSSEVLARLDEFTREVNKLKQMLGNKEAAAIPTTIPTDSLVAATEKQMDQQQKKQQQKQQQIQLIKAAGRAAFLATMKRRKGRKGSNK